MNINRLLTGGYHFSPGKVAISSEWNLSVRNMSLLLRTLEFCWDEFFVTKFMRMSRKFTMNRSLSSVSLKLEIPLLHTWNREQKLYCANESTTREKKLNKNTKKSRSIRFTLVHKFSKGISRLSSALDEDFLWKRIKRALNTNHFALDSSSRKWNLFMANDWTEQIHTVTVKFSLLTKVENHRSETNTTTYSFTHSHMLRQRQSVLSQIE